MNTTKQITVKQGKRSTTVAIVRTERGYFSLTGEAWEASNKETDPDYRWNDERGRWEYPDGTEANWYAPAVDGH